MMQKKKNQRAFARCCFSLLSVVSVSAPAQEGSIDSSGGFVSEMNATLPSVLSMHNGGTSIGDAPEYGDHNVAAVGYVSGITNFVTIHDTWDQNNHLIQDGNWNNIMTNRVRP